MTGCSPSSQSGSDNSIIDFNMTLPRVDIWWRETPYSFDEMEVKPGHCYLATSTLCTMTVVDYQLSAAEWLSAGIVAHNCIHWHPLSRAWACMVQKSQLLHVCCCHWCSMISAPSPFCLHSGTWQHKLVLHLWIATYSNLSLDIAAETFLHKQVCWQGGLKLAVLKQQARMFTCHSIC